MSEEGQRQEQQHNSINFHINNETAEATNEEESAVQSLPNRTARAGALVLQAFQGRKGGISPSKVLACWTKKLVSFRTRCPSSARVFESFGSQSSSRNKQVHSIEADKNTFSSSKEALDLYEAISTSSRLKPIELEPISIGQVIDILQTHPVSHRWPNIDTRQID